MILSIEEEPFEQLYALMLTAKAQGRGLRPLEEAACRILTAMARNTTKLAVKASTKRIQLAREVPGG